MKTKICTKCKQEKPLTDEYYYKRKTGKDGFRNDCKVCFNAQVKKNRDSKKEYYKEYRRVYYQNNKERIDKINQQYFQDNKKNIYETKRKWNEKNRGKVKEYSRNWGRRNKEQVLANGQKWREKNRERANAITQRRRAKKANLPSTLTPEQWTVIKKKFNNSCAYCGMTEKEHKEQFNEELHQDHFIPLSKGGEYTHNNMIPACRKCNLLKHAKDFFEWYPKHEHYSKEREKKILEYLNYKNEGIQQLALTL